MARLMFSAGMLTDFALATAVRRRGLPSGSPPPSFAATVISLPILVKTLPRLASMAAFLCFVVAHFECPDIGPPENQTAWRLLSIPLFPYPDKPNYDPNKRASRAKAQRRQKNLKAGFLKPYALAFLCGLAALREIYLPFEVEFISSLLLPLVRIVLHIFPELREDHSSRGGLEHARHGHVHVLIDVLAAVLHHDHGSVVKIADALAGLLPLLEHEDPHGLARKGHGLHGVRKVVDVQHFDALELCHLVEVEVVRNHFSAELLGQGDKLAVHLADLGKIVLDDPDLHVAHLLDAVQDVEPTPAPRPLQRVR